MMQARRGIGTQIVQDPKQVEASLWRRYCGDRDPACREALFNQYQTMAIKMARKEFGRRPAYGLERGDFEQFAYAGLLEAIDKFDPSKTTPFSAFARRRILGSITDGLAGSSERGTEYAFRNRMERERLRSLRSDNKSEDAIAKLSNLVAGLAIGFILEDTLISESGEPLDPGPNAYESLSWRELRIKLKTEIETLPPPEKTVITQHYIKGVSFTRIAKLLQVTKSRISQLHKTGIGRLRDRLKAFF